MNNAESLLFYIMIFLSAGILMSTKVSRLRTFFSSIGVLILIIVASQRYYVGTDYVTYSNIAIRNGNTPWNDILSFSNIFNEIGFVIFSKVTYMIGGLEFFFALSALITILPILKTLKDEYPHTNLIASMITFLFFFYPTSYNIIRQYIAAAFVFYGIKYIFLGDFKKYFLVILFATTFHKSALVAIPIYFLWDNNKEKIIDKRPLIFFLFGATLLIINYQSIIGMLSGVSVFNNYGSYAIAHESGKNRDFYLYIVIFIFMILLQKPLANLDKRNNLFLIMLFLSILIGYTGFFHPQVKRIGIYFQLPLIILNGYVHLLFQKKSRLIIISSIIVIQILYFVLIYYLIGSGELFPYKIAAISNDMLQNL